MPNVKHVAFDTVAAAPAIDAFEAAHGVRALADYDFSKAEAIVSVGADFLGDWQGGGYDGYAKTRVPNKHHGKATMSKHFQFEANMTLSGANADIRIPAAPSAQKNILAHIYAAITGTAVSGKLSQAHQAKVDAAGGIKMQETRRLLFLVYKTRELKHLCLPSITHLEVLLWMQQIHA